MCDDDGRVAVGGEGDGVPAYAGMTWVEWE